MYFVYDKDGKKFRMNHRIDQRAAINTGKYSKNPPGVEEPIVPEPVKGEAIEGVVIDRPVEVKKLVIEGEIIKDKKKLQRPK